MIEVKINQSGVSGKIKGVAGIVVQGDLIGNLDGNVTVVNGRCVDNAGMIPGNTKLSELQAQFSGIFDPVVAGFLCKLAAETDVADLWMAHADVLAEELGLPISAAEAIKDAAYRLIKGERRTPQPTDPLLLYYGRLKDILSAADETDVIINALSEHSQILESTLMDIAGTPEAAIATKLGIEVKLAWQLKGIVFSIVLGS